MADVRIFSYLPNPRLYKATIAASMNGVDVEIIGAKPSELKDWLWDFDAHPLTDEERADESTLRIAGKGFSGGIHKTEAFIKAQPFGTVPAAFSGDGQTGIFESNSILRIVGRLGQARVPLYGRDHFEATRIDSFLDASLTFAVESQKYLFAFGDLEKLGPAHTAMSTAYETYMRGIDQALATGDYIVGDRITLADIAFACELTLFALERHENKKLAKVDAAPIFDNIATDCQRAHAHYRFLLDDPVFAADLKRYFDTMTMKQLFS